MGTAITACAMISAISAIVSGTGWRGFMLAMASLGATAAVLMAAFWTLGILP